MTVGNYNLDQIWLQINKNQRLLQQVVVVVLVIYLLAYAAELTWRLFPAPDQMSDSLTVSRAGPSSARTSDAKVNLTSLKRLNLFGDLTAKPVVKQETTDAPKTTLNLTLTGVVASSDAKVAAAIIENRGAQNTYGIDEKIDGTNAFLKEVFADRVIIRNSGRNETLMLDGVDYTKTTSTARTSRPVRSAPRPSDPDTIRRTLSRDQAEATREIRKSPTSFSDYIAIAPFRHDGRLLGYRVSPGRKTALFKAAGFVAGDIVTDINGLDLTDPQQSLEAMQALRSSESLQLTVDREGELVTLYLELPASDDADAD